MIRRLLSALCVAVFAGGGAFSLAAQATLSPHGTLPRGMDCAACHTATGWRPLRQTLAFDHGKVAGFALTGAHVQATCAGCHLDLKFDAPQASADDCASCHADVHQGRMTQSCVSCHDTRSFRDVDGEAVHARTSFPLTGAHRQVTCESCHVSDVGGAFTPLPTECVSCHRAAYEGARTVDHVANGYPTTCTECHGTVGWSDAPAFDHGTASGGFTLVGAHQGLRCESCHRTPGMDVIFPATSQDDCAACHQADFDRQHGGSGFPTTCLDCHTVDTWSGATFDHASRAGFPLSGPHEPLVCAACHTGDHNALRFPTPADPTDCVACHRADYDHEHTGSGFPTTCLSCHVPDRWDGASFDHSTTAFPLLGAHAPVECAACHGPPGLATLAQGPQDCAACHQTDYDGAHAGSSFPTECAACHTVAGWQGATVDHVQISNGFALVGPHADAACSACHSVPDYKLLFPQPAGQDDCVACHQAEYDTEHAGSDFPTTCLSCHVADTWAGATVDHPSISGGFPLLGVHAGARCSACHQIPGYALLFPQPTGENDCVACHQSDYDGAHGSGIPTDCASCHTSAGWSGATVDHGQLANGFALAGPHADAACTSCHAVPGYQLLFAKPAGQNDCVVCHQADYDAQHAGSGFPTTCLSCHVADTWTGATVDHAQISNGFALVGPHAGAECTSCHAVPGYQLLFPQPASQDDCVACHQADYDAQHAGSGFPTTCLSCHVTNTWAGGTVDHPSISGGFQLLGSHATAQCTACHAVPGYQLLFPQPAGNNDCVACHQADFNGAHAGSGFPTDCSACHNVTAWQPSSFDHDAQFFPIYSGSHRGKWNSCNDCHTGGVLSSFTCLSCHEHNQSSMDNKHRGRNGYAYESGACLSCHPRGRGG